MRTPRAVAIFLTLGLIGTACGARVPSDVRKAASNAILSSNGSSSTSTDSSNPSTTTDNNPSSNSSNPNDNSSSNSNVTNPSSNSNTNTNTNTNSNSNSNSNSNTNTNQNSNTPSGGGCPSSISGPGVTSSTITLGTIADRTGPVSGLFAGAQNGAIAFANYMNANGGLCGHRVIIDFADSGTNCSQYQNDVQSLLPKVFAFVGSFSLYDGCGVSLFKSHTATPDIHVALDPTAVTPPNHYDIEPGQLGYATGPFAYFKQKLGTKVQHVGVITENIPSAEAKQKAIDNAAATQGWKFVYFNAASPTTSNFTSNFQTACGRNHIQVFFTVSENAQNAATMLANERSVSACKGVVNIIPIAYDSAFLPDYQGSASDLNGLLGYNEYSLFFNSADAANIPEVNLFQTWFKKSNPGQTLNLYAMFAWSGGRMLQYAFEHAKQGTQAGVQTALKAMKKWDDNGLIAPNTPSSKTTGNTCYVLWQLQNSQFSRVASPKAGFRCDGRFVPYNG